MIPYNIAIRLLRAGIKLASYGKTKARAWIEGRKNLFERIKDEVEKDEKTIWIHAASAGELEQGKSLIEALRSSWPDHKIVISFFSPSGFEAGKKYKMADVVCYMPLDTVANARQFLDVVHPSLVVFIKYEYWLNHLTEVAERKIPLLLVSAIFRKEQAFFKWYGGFYRKILGKFNWIFVQDSDSEKLLQETGIKNCSVAGDTRFDRVLAIRDNGQPVAHIGEFLSGHRVIVAGSTWKEDEALLAGIKKELGFKLVIAPHEINHNSIERIEKLFPDETTTYSALVQSKQPKTNARVIIIDNYGMLSRLYRYGDISYIGGGFNKSGIHNTLEAAVWGKPVLFGPNYRKFREAKELIGNGAAFSVSNAKQLSEISERLFSSSINIGTSGYNAKKYVEENAGATEKIMDHIQRNRLLTTS